MRIFGVVLAGGEGRRMGGADKALLRLAGQTLLSHVVDRLEPQVERLAISANGDPARFGLGLPVLADAQVLGPLAGVLAALRWARPLGATAVVTAAVDSPFLPPDLVPRLCMAAETAPEGLALAHSAKDHPTFALWPVSIEPALAAFLESGQNPRVLAFADAHHAARAPFPDEAAFQNLNTPEDLARAETLLRSA